MANLFSHKGIVCNDGGIVKNSTITTSSIDMNLQNITSVKDPILRQDAATKAYVDNVGVSASYNANLIGTTYTVINGVTQGSYLITVNSQVNNAPYATFQVSKSRSDEYSARSRITASPGKFTFEQLEIIWPPNSGILLHKTGLNYDGVYISKFV